MSGLTWERAGSAAKIAKAEKSRSVVSRKEPRVKECLIQGRHGKLFAGEGTVLNGIETVASRSKRAGTRPVKFRVFA